MGPGSLARTGPTPPSNQYAELNARNCSSDNSTDAAAQFSARCSIEPVPGIGTMTGERCNNHASDTCAGAAPSSAATLPSAPRDPRCCPAAIGSQGTAQVVAVLDARDVDDSACGLDLPDRDLGQSDPVDLALGTQSRERSELVLQWDERVDPVQLEQLDPFDPQPPLRQLRLLPQVLGPAERPPHPRPALPGLPPPVRARRAACGRGRSGASRQNQDGARTGCRRRKRSVKHSCR